MFIGARLNTVTNKNEWRTASGGGEVPSNIIGENEVYNSKKKCFAIHQIALTYADCKKLNSFICEIPLGNGE